MELTVITRGLGGGREGTGEIVMYMGFATKNAGKILRILSIQQIFRYQRKKKSIASFIFPKNAPHARR